MEFKRKNILQTFLMKTMIANNCKILLFTQISDKKILRASLGDEREYLFFDFVCTFFLNQLKYLLTTDIVTHVGFNVHNQNVYQRFTGRDKCLRTKNKL